MGSLQGKRGVIFGVANQWSIAWAIAQECAAQGAALAIAYQTERFEKSVRDLVDGADMAAHLVQCDVSLDDQIDRAFAEMGQLFGGRLDFLVHCIAYAPPDALKGRYVDTSREAFRVALDISAYSLVALTRAAEPLMAEGGSIVTLSYLGAQRSIPGYGVMGTAKAALENEVVLLAAELGRKNIRVNAISAGPINTMSARGIKDFNMLREYARSRAPLGRDVEPREVAKAVVFLASSGTAVTGHVLYVDGGYNVVGF